MSTGASALAWVNASDRGCGDGADMATGERFRKMSRGHPALYSDEMTFAFQVVHYMRGGVSLSPNTLTSHPRADTSVIL